MPEGHTLHRLAREQQRIFGGTIVQASSPQGRFAAGAEQLDGRELVRTEAYGKHLLHHYGPTPADDGRMLHVHLGLYGKFRTGRGDPPEPAGPCGCGWPTTRPGPTCAARLPANS